MWKFTSGQAQCQADSLSFSSIELERSDASRVACKPKQRRHPLQDQAASVDDHIELYITGDQRQMERPYDGRRAECHKDQTAQRH